MMCETTWRDPQTSTDVLVDEAHVWRAWLDQPAWRVQALARFLSADERQRAEQYRFERDRVRFIVGRGLLRTILGKYLRIEPGDIRFAYGAFGKPTLEKPVGRKRLQFNVAHSGELALYAFTRDRAIGVDVERCRPLPDAGQLVERFFSSQEAVTWRRLLPYEQPAAFFNCWTRKEAFIKAVGDGLSHPLDQFAVSLTPGEPARLLQASGDPEAASTWELHALTPADGYVAALAVKRPPCRLTYYDVP